jgi:hypothetical protein
LGCRNADAGLVSLMPMPSYAKDNKNIKDKKKYLPRTGKYYNCLLNSIWAQLLDEILDGITDLLRWCNHNFYHLYGCRDLVKL